MVVGDQKVTIVLNSHNRPASLTRIIDCVDKKLTNTNVIIVDSSNERGRQHIIKSMNQNTNSNQFELKSFPEDTPVFNKLFAAANSVTTKYIQYFADDDAICPDTISDRIKFLESNSEYAACLGRQYYCHKGEKDYTFWFEFQGQIGTFCDDDPLQRIEALVRNWVSFSYSTMRTDVAQKAFKLASDVEPNGKFFGERILYIAMLICGKVNLLDIPSICLSVHTDRTSEKISTLQSTIFSQTANEEYEKFLQQLSAFLYEMMKLDFEYSRELGERFITRHLAFWMLAPKEELHLVKEKAFHAHNKYSTVYSESLVLAVKRATDRYAVENAVLSAELHRESKKMLDVLTATP
ncbi:MAG: hypothetical protein CBB92_11595 [Flammeovirgaceae bacterium TMED32]|nr:MAG: hypothetical protein CBB92_11595 [Flammeovirgaceae bacterium TMED32]|tara:strand:- start:2274 stop:3326 length:1053 start_codon:yes stop_codon:yes gene_type:complete